MYLFLEEEGMLEVSSEGRAIYCDWDMFGVREEGGIPDAYIWVLERDAEG